MDLTLKMCSPFLPALFNLSHPLGALDLVAGNGDKNRLPPPVLVIVLLPPPATQVATQEAPSPLGSTTTSPEIVHLERKKQQLLGDLALQLVNNASL